MVGKILLAVAVVIAGVCVQAEPVAPLIAHDPLTSMIMKRQLVMPIGGITGAVRIGSGESIALKLSDPFVTLKPAEGLVEKPEAKTPRKARRAVEQLKKAADRADWRRAD
jgi:hypothetical protein